MKGMRVTVLTLVCAVWIGAILACGNQASTETTGDTVAPAPVAPPLAPAPVPPPPPAPMPPPVAPAPAAPVAPAVPAAAPVACGETGQPLCPMQAYMKSSMTAAMRAGGAPLAEALTKVSAWAPDPSWNEGATGWSTVAQAGATAASAGDRAGATAACKGCHTAWQKRYRAEFRPRPIP